jgi:predicted  nucleic acid-binding Zn-ribbon protein
MPPTPKKASAPASAKSVRSKSTAPKSTSKSIRTVVAPSASEPTLALTDLHLRLAGLEKENEKLLKKISKKRQELDKFVGDVEEIGREMITRGSVFMSQIQELDQEIHQIFTRIFDTRKMGKNTAQMVEEVYFCLQSSQAISINPKRRPKSFLEQMLGLDPNFNDSDDESDESEAENGSRGKGFGNYFDSEDDEPTDKIDREEARKIRQTFLRLAAVFHPDKLEDESKKDDYEEVMKEVNAAYQRGDLARLLEIEKQYNVGEIIDLTNADDLTIRCRQLDRENELLKEQQVSIQKEMKEMKKSQPGQMLKEYQTLKKQGIEPIEELMAEAENNLENVQIIRDFVLSFCNKEITVEKFKRGPVLKEMYEDDDDDDFFDFDEREIINSIFR